MSYLKTKIVLLDPICMPEKKSEGAAAFDLVARETVAFPAHTTVKIPVGIKLELPPRTEAQIRGRSGNNANGYWVIFGTVDEDYRGEVSVVMHNSRDGSSFIKRGDRIAQMVIMDRPLVQLEVVSEGELSKTERGDGGFGSTGK